MKKSIFRWGFVLCMLVGLLTIGASAMSVAPDIKCAGDHASGAGNYIKQAADGSITCGAGTFADGVLTLATATYYLDSDITLDSLQIKFNAASHLCLNGHNITVKAQTAEYFVHALNSRVVSLCNCKADGGQITITDAEGTSSSIFHMMRSGSSAIKPNFSLQNVTFKGCSVDKLVTYLLDEADPTLNLVNTKFEGNTFATSCDWAKGTLNMYAGSSIDNAVAVSGGTFNMGGTATGAVTVSGGTFNMEGGTAKGGVTVSSGTFTMNDGTIDTTNVTVSGGTFTMNDGTITDIVGVSPVHIKGGTFNMYGGYIKENGDTTTKTGMGGGVQVQGGTFNMHNGYIQNNTATNGTGVFVRTNGVFNMYDGYITNNNGTNDKAYNACGLFVGANSGTSANLGYANIYGGEISGSTLSNGTANYDVMISQGEYVQEGGTIAGGVCLYKLATGTPKASFKGGVCSNIANNASKPGEYTISGGTFGYSGSATQLKDHLVSDVPVSFEAVTVEGWDRATKVTPGFERTGESYEFKSDLNFGLIMNCNNSFVANNPEYEYVCAISSAAGTYELTKVSEDTMLKLMATGITAKEIGTPITFTIKSTDGETVFFNETLSVADIAAAQWATTEDAAMKTLYEDMVNYGNAAATVFSGTTVDALGTGSVAPTWVHSEGYGASADGIAIATLSLKDKIQLNIYIDGEAVVEGGVYNAETGITTVTYDDIAIADAMEPITLTFTVGEQEYTVVYSIKDYVVDALNNGTQVELIGALQKYIASVCAVCAEAEA